MSTGLRPIFKYPIGIRYKHIRCPALGNCYDALDDIAWEIGCKPITQMIDSYMEDEANPWMNSRKGMMAVAALMAYLQHNPGSVDDQDTVLDELREIKKVISVASEDDIPFHLSNG